MVHEEIVDLLKIAAQFGVEAALAELAARESAALEELFQQENFR